MDSSSARTGVTILGWHELNIREVSMVLGHVQGDVNGVRFIEIEPSDVL